MRKFKFFIVGILSIAVLSVTFTGTVANAWRAHNTRDYNLNITTVSL